MSGAWPSATGPPSISLVAHQLAPCAAAGSMRWQVTSAPPSRQVVVRMPPVRSMPSTRPMFENGGRPGAIISA